MDDPTANDADGRWLTYAELADLRSISRKAAARLTTRHGWRRQPGNDGAARVFVPTLMATRQVHRHDPPTAPPSRNLLPQALAALEAAVTTLSDQLAAKDAALAEAKDAAREAQEAIRALRERAEQAEAQLAEGGKAEDVERLRTTIDELHAGQTMMLDMHARELEQARAETQLARDAAASVWRADEARKARGRLRRALDGWRGR